MTRLSAGTRLGPYEIVGPIGAGGMGEVYRARDTRLNREVAVKVLPDLFADDPERLARFTREAQALAALNHPNIATIHGFEEGAGVSALVMEVVEGDTLAERLRAGALPLPEATRIALQIADALEAAHEKGIVHRDLKPANIKITPDGRVKVLDFGLAKMLAPDAEPASPMNSPTVMAATAGGSILGTAAYMSPEQARGKTVDKRTDVWAFGCVLYEMLTGLQVFGGDTITDIVAAVVKNEPEWTALPADTPPAIRRLLKRCLAKDARERLHDIGDARLDIAEAQSEPTQAPVVASPMSHTRSSRAWPIAAAVAALTAIALAWPAVLHLRETAPDAPEMRLEIATPTTSDPFSFAVSPDGRRLVFVATGDGRPRLWLRALDTASAQLLAGTEEGSLPFWSPDGRSIGFFGGGKLRRLDLNGGPPQALADAAGGRGGTWGRDGVILFAPVAGGGIVRVPAAGGEAVPVTRPTTGQANHHFPHFLPDGRQFLFFAQGTNERIGVYLGALDGGEPVRLTAAESAPAFLPPDWVLWVRQGALVARRIDLPRRALTGEAVTLADPVGFDGALATGAFAVSAAGLVAYRAGGTSRRQLTWVDRTGRVLGTIGAADDEALQYPELAPDGRRVAVDRTVKGNRDVWVFDVSRGVPTRLTFDASQDMWPTWTPDGQTIVFRSTRTGGGDFYQKPASGAGNERALFTSPDTKYPLEWSPDGRFLLYRSDDPKTGSDLWIFPRDGPTPKPFVQTPFVEAQGEFSPDGRWVTYCSNESGRMEIYVVPFPGPGGKWQVSTAGGQMPRWRRDGREVFYMSPDSKLMAAPIHANGATLEVGIPVALFPMHLAMVSLSSARQQYDVASDRRFLLNVLVEDTAPPPITLVLNWKPK